MLANCWIILLGLHAILAIEKPDSLSEKYEDLLSSAMNEYNQMSDEKYLWIPVKVLDIRSIHETGMHFTIKIAIALSNCTKIYTMANFRHTTMLTVRTAKRQGRSVQSVISNTISADSLESEQHWMEQKMETLWDSFLKFAKKFKREYSSVGEQLNRFRVFVQNMHTVEKLQREEKGTAVYGVTKFSDMTPEEFQKVMLPSLWLDRMNSLSSSSSSSSSSSNENEFDLNDFNLSLSDLPRQFDWRTKGAVTAVKNQGACGSCWAFSVTGNIEGLWAIKTGQLISLSEQQLLDCDTRDHGCNGGIPIVAFRAVKRMGGLEPEDQYPYEAMNGTCHLVRSEIAVKIDDAVEIPSNETVMQAWVAQRGPLSVGIDAELLIHYRTGILHPSRSRCPPSKINHGVLITGYGIENGLPYWTVKNSWGSQWGEHGYFRLMRGKDVCGVSDMASSAIIY